MSVITRRAARVSAFVALALAAAIPTPAAGQALADVFERIQGAVVVVYTESTEYALRDRITAVSVEGTGSGVLISPNQVLTAAHVVQAANQVVVVFPDGEQRTASVSNSSATHDVALLTLDRAVSYTPVPLGDSDQARIGQEVFVVGAPLGESHTLTVGYLSARRQRSGMLGIAQVEFLQTDASINHGNSGGPMFNMNGEVIGIVSHILSETGGSVGLGYAVSSNTARSVLLEQGMFWTGVSGMPVTGALAVLLNVPPPGGGVLIQHIARNSLGEQLGLVPATIPVTIAGVELKIGGDIVIEIQGIPLGPELENAERIQREVFTLPPGTQLRVKVLRAGEIVELVAVTPR